MAAELTPDALLGWADAYELAWRDPSAHPLDRLFAPDAEYVVEPYAEPATGLAAIAQLWADESEPVETFTMERQVVACSGDTGVLRVLVRYGEPLRQEYLDLWVVTFDAEGRATRFEEWPFWPTHGRSPQRSDPVVVDAAAVPAATYGEWVRASALSSGIYRLATGAHDGQSPHEEDEVYVVTAGTAHLEIDGVRTPVRPGTVAYVPRLVPHRFVDITDDLEVAVVFAPPESS
ncbi:MAG TPA: cupin domain-containing protein [Actinomycetes bacterium]